MSPIRSRRWTPPGRRGWAAAIGITAALGVLVASLALAVHEEGFQMDGNVEAADHKTNYPNAGDVLGSDFDGPYDWDSVFTAAGAPKASLPDGFLDAEFVKDFRTKTQRGATVFDTSDGTTYTTGSKDILPISGWRCVGANNATDKGDIMNAYATVFINDEGDRILYFGLEKFVDNGNNNIGFWFLGDGSVGCPENQTGNGTAFSGAHADGDLLIVSEFTNGGGVSSIKAYEWIGGANGSLSSQPLEVGVDCVRGDQSFVNIDICATTNVLPIDVPWASASKTGGLGGLYPSATFFEGAINLDDTPFGDSCFNTFLANTRSSQETTATLYDWAMGDLTTCGKVTVNKVTGPNTSDPTDFDFTTTRPAGSTVPASFMLDTDPTSVTPPATVVYENVAPGAYTITEGAETGWYLSSLVCTKNGDAFSGGDATSVATRTSTFQVGFGDIIECTYTNLKPDAAIDVTGDGTNRVDDDHEFTATTWADPGDGTMALVGGVDVTFALTDANGADTTGATLTCTTEADDADPDFGSCSITIDSLTTGTTTGTASATITVGGVAIAVDSSTDAKTTGAESVLKKWVDAAIDITGDGTNRVGDDHDFTVTTYAEGSGDGATMSEVGGVLVTVSFAEALGSDAVADDTCTTEADPADPDFGTCSVTFSSDATGTTTGTASATITVEGEEIEVTTGDDATVAANEDVLKTWVDARIGIAGTDTNGIGEPHTFTVTLEKDLGDGLSFIAAAGEDVDAALVDADGAVHVLDTDDTTCNVPGDTHVGTGTDSNGQCVVVFVSDTAGTVTGSASASISVGGVDAFEVSTGDANSPTDETVVKTYVDGSIAWLKDDHNGEPLPGATFEVCRTHDLDTSGTPDVMVALSQAASEATCVTVLDNDALDNDPADGQLELIDLILGRYTVEETIPPTGYSIKTSPGAGPHTFPDMSLAAPDVDLAVIFVNEALFRILVLTCDDSSDTLVDGTVTLDATSKQTILPADFALLGWKKADGTPLTQQDLCNLGFASFGGLEADTYDIDVEVPDRDPFFTPL